MKSSRLLHGIGVALLAGTLSVAFPGISSAVFTSTSQSTATVRAAADWTPPTVSLATPAAFVRGTEPVVATAADKASGIAKVTVELLPPGGGWTVLCAPTAAPYSCSWNTTSRADGAYSLRATAVDKIGLQTVSAIARTTVDNTAPTVTMVDPGATLTGSRSFSVNGVADAGSGIAGVVIQYAPTGTTAYQDLCTVTAAPWSCSKATGTLNDGRYDFRAVATDKAGNTTTSPVVVNRTVDNGPALAGADIQAQNGGSTVGLIEAGDSITYTFNRQVNLSTIIAGWNGSAKTVQVRLGSGFITNDTLEVVGTNLGSINLRWNFINYSSNVSATMQASTETTSSGQVRTVVTVLLTEAPGILQTRTVTNEGSLVWSPSNAVSDLLGRSSSATSITELGTLDKDF